MHNLQKLLAGCQRGGSCDAADGYSSFCRSGVCIPVQGNSLDRWGTKLALSLALKQLQQQHFNMQSCDLQGWISPRPLLIVVIVPVVFAGGYCLIAGGQGRNKHARRAVRQVSLLTAGVYFMSPLLQTLTKSVSRSAPFNCPAKSISIPEHPVHCAGLQYYSNSQLNQSIVSAVTPLLPLSVVYWSCICIYMTTTLLISSPTPSPEAWH